MVSQGLVAAIVSAFGDVSRPPETTFAHCGQCEIWLERFLRSPVQDWRSLPPDDIASEYAALTAVTPMGWKFLLPAYLIWYLENPQSSSNTRDHLIWQLTLRADDEPNKRSCFEALNANQVGAVHDFLCFVATHGSENSQREDAARALNSFWDGLTPNNLLDRSRP